MISSNGCHHQYDFSVAIIMGLMRRSKKCGRIESVLFNQKFLSWYFSLNYDLVENTTNVQCYHLKEIGKKPKKMGKCQHGVIDTLELYLYHSLECLGLHERTEQNDENY